MEVKLFKEAYEIRHRLENLGLTTADFEQAARAGFLAQASCTQNDVPVFPGIMRWGMTVRNFRNQVIPRGWKRFDKKNAGLTINPNKKIAVMMATGDEATGNDCKTPRTKSIKGNFITASIKKDLQIPLFPKHILTLQTEDLFDFKTWVFLVRVSDEKIRSELSLAIDVDASGRISTWEERIIFPDINTDPEIFNETLDEFNPTPVINITRRG